MLYPARLWPLIVSSHLPSDGQGPSLCRLLRVLSLGAASAAQPSRSVNWWRVVGLAFVLAWFIVTAALVLLLVTRWVRLS